MTLSESDSVGHKRFGEEPLPKRPRIEEEEDKEEEVSSKEGPKLVADPAVVVVEEPEELFTPTGTYEDWLILKKKHVCRICGGVGHYDHSCKLASFCTMNTRITPFAEIVCYCCGEAVEKNHPNEHANNVAKRAVLKY